MLGSFFPYSNWFSHRQQLPAISGECKYCICKYSMSVTQKVVQSVLWDLIGFIVFHLLRVFFFPALTHFYNSVAIFCILPLSPWLSSLGFCTGWAVSISVHHGRARPRANGLWSRPASWSPGDSWHQYAGPRAQTPGHAPWTTCHHQGPHVGRHRGALWHLGKSLKPARPGAFLDGNTNVVLGLFIIAQWPRSISRFSS